jgi:glycosyltransferase involved in cell wall biosynthesis
MRPPIQRPLVVIPAVDEEESIGGVLAAVRAANPGISIVVVDDGSHDETARIAREAGSPVLSHATNIGVGGAMRTGFLYAHLGGFDAVIQVDGDGQHDPAHIPAILAGLKDFDVVVGNRFGPGSTYDMGRLRRTAARLLSRVVSIHVRRGISDATSGFRGTGPRAIRMFAHHYPTEYLGDTVESLVLAAKAGLSVGEVPVGMGPRTAGNPSQNLVKSVGHLARALFVAFQSFVRRAPAGAPGMVEGAP